MNAPSAIRKATSRRATTVLFGAVVLAVSCLFFARDLPSDPRFVDEAAFLSQSYFWDLASERDWNSPQWLEYPAYDLPPLPKYLIGISLKLHGLSSPGRYWAIAWYRNTSEARFASATRLSAARWPSVYLGAIGCVAIFAIGTMVCNRRVGLLASALLMINPLYRLHAHRAMADVPTEAIVLVTLAFALPLWRRALSGRLGVGWLALGAIIVGLFAGLAVLAKLNGGLALMTVAAWAALAMVLPMLPHLRSRHSTNESVRLDFTRAIRFWELTAIATLIALFTFVALNPFVTARPAGGATMPLMAPVPANQTVFQRLATVIQHRVDVSRDGQRLFPHDALTTIADKFSVLAVQGFGRFGPFGPAHSDSTRRFDRGQDWGAWLWLPCVLMGLVWSIARGTRQRSGGEPPTVWAIAVQFLVAMATVGLFLPLAWDRYFLPIQASSALLVSGATVAAFDAIRWQAARA